MLAKQVAAMCMVVSVGCQQPVTSTAAIPSASSVVFSSPRDGQLDVPLGAHVIVSWSGPVAEQAMTGVSLVGPDGPVAITTTLAGGGATLDIESTELMPGASYAVSIAGEAAPILHFTTRSDRPRSGPPSLVAFDGSPPEHPGQFRRITETATVELVFSEPLDPRTVVVEPGGIELVDASGAEVPVTIVARGIHVALDPSTPLVAGAAYEVRIGGNVMDLGGERAEPMSIAFAPEDSIGAGTTGQVFRTRVPGDPLAQIARTDATNRMALSHPLIGQVVGEVEPSTLASQLGDPEALGGPIAFTIPKGQRLAMTGLDIALAGTVPSGLATGELSIELVTDATGMIARNRFRPDAEPDNAAAPLDVSLSLDLAISARDPTGNAALAETIVGAQLSGLAMVDDGVLAIETVGAMDVGLLGLATAPANLALDLISDPAAVATLDTRAPALVTSLPAPDSATLDPDDAIELVFDEPVDLSRARDGGVVLRDASCATIPSTLELAGSVLVVRARHGLPDGQIVTVDLAGVTDLAGNAMPPVQLHVATPAMTATTTPATLLAMSPGTACALTAATPATSGRCSGGTPGDDRYRPFSLAANERVHAVFDQPISASTVSLGTSCGTGSVRVEHLDETGTCTDSVAGTLEVRRRELTFVPDVPWHLGDHYRVRLVSGSDAMCDPGELCGRNNVAVSFDPLSGIAAGGGADVVVELVATPPTTGTTLFAATAPVSDVNASGGLDASERAGDRNRVAVRVATTAGLITSATFPSDCVPETPEVEACMYVTGAMPAQLGERRDNCELPDGTTVPTCVPVTLSAQTMLSTSMTMTAAALGIGITTSTGMSVMRMREPVDGPIEGYIVDRDGVPTMIVALSLYMDAPAMSLPFSQHDLHSKQLSVTLSGPLTFRSDGRIAIELSNTDEVPISVGIQAPLGITGTVGLVVPPHGMSLQLMSPPQRARLP